MNILFDFGENTLSTGDTLQVKLSFVVQAIGADLTPTAEDYQLIIVDHGKLEWKTDIEDFLMVPGVVEMTFGDIGQIIYNAIHLGTMSVVDDFTVTNKRPTLFIYFNGSIEYEGQAIEDAIGYDRDKKEAKISFSSGTEILNELALYDDETPNPNCLNPMGYSGGQLDTHWGAVNNTLMVNRLINDIFKKVNSGIDVDILQNWTFKGYKTEAPLDPIWKDDFTFYDIRTWAGRYYGDKDNGLSSVADVLRMLALEWGCLAGVLSKHKAFFRQLFYYDDTNEQTLGIVLKHEIEHGLSRVEFVKFQCAIDENSNSGREGTFTKLDYKKINETAIACFFGDPQLQSPESVIEATYGGDRYYITRCQDYNIAVPTGWNTNVNMLVAMWYLFRYDYDKCRVDHFKVSGLDYDFTKCFTYDGTKYYTIGLSKIWEEGASEIDALYLGDA